MNEPTPQTSEPATGPVVTPPQARDADVSAQTVYAQPPPRRLTKVAAWVGIAAGSVFIVAVIFSTGFFVGKNVGGGQRGDHGGHQMVMRPGPAMFPMGPRGDFERKPGFPGPFGPGGPMIEVPRSPGGDAPQPSTATTAPPRP